MTAETPAFRFDVFLSHRAKDKAVVRPLAERLRMDGLRVWLDEWKIKPGDSIPAKIDLPSPGGPGVTGEGLEHAEYGIRNEGLPYPCDAPGADSAAVRKVIEQCGYCRRKKEVEGAKDALRGER